MEGGLLSLPASLPSHLLAVVRASATYGWPAFVDVLQPCSPLLVSFIGCEFRGGAALETLRPLLLLLVQCQAPA